MKEIMASGNKASRTKPRDTCLPRVSRRGCRITIQAALPIPDGVIIHTTKGHMTCAHQPVPLKISLAKDDVERLYAFSRSPKFHEALWSSIYLPFLNSDYGPAKKRAKACASLKSKAGALYELLNALICAKKHPSSFLGLIKEIGNREAASSYYRSNGRQISDINTIAVTAYCLETWVKRRGNTLYEYAGIASFIDRIEKEEASSHSDSFYQEYIAAKPEKVRLLILNRMRHFPIGLFSEEFQELFQSLDIFPIISKQSPAPSAGTRDEITPIARVRARTKRRST